MFPSAHSLNDIFTNEEACIEFLFLYEILYSLPKCLKCRKKTYRNKILWKCKDYNCNWSISIYKDSIFTQSKLPAHRTMFVFYLWLAKCSSSSIELVTGHSSATISSILATLHNMIYFNITENRVKIGGEGIIVEIDESKFGKRKYNRGHKVDGVWIVGGVERTTLRRIFAEPVADRSPETLLKVIQDNIEPGSIIYSDLWRGYNDISRCLDMQHLTVNHSVNFVDPVTGVHTNMIEGSWNGIKIGIPARNYKKGKVENHIAEFIWKRQNENDLWNAFLKVLGSTKFN